MDTKHIFSLIEERKNELFEILSSLVKINSENYRSHGNERFVAEHLESLCREIGLESDLYSPLDIENFEDHPDYTPGRGLEDRYNLTARWKGAENIDELMLMGHSDTVLIGDVANWEKDPLSGEISDGKIWGRGVGDDKYALATVVFLIKLLKEQGFVPKRNLLFTAYSDEENGGSHGALAAVIKYPCPRIVNMDGREDQIWHCGSGGQVVYYTYRTKNSVDSAKLASSAIPIVIEEIEKFGDRRRKELSENRYYAGTVIPKTALRYMDVHVGNLGLDLGIGKIIFSFYTERSKEEIYEEFEELESVLKKKLDHLGIVGGKVEPRTRFFHYVSCEPDSEDIKMMLEASSEASGRKPIVCGSCLSDLSVISKYGSSRAFAFGMGRDFSQPGGSHQPNEYIECDKLIEYAKTVAAYIIKVL